jgi:hypothetical protein
MDVARFAAVIVRRDPSTLDRADAALTRLLEAYGEPPPDLDWYLAAQILCQVGSPFRKAWPDWPQKLEAIIAAAETVLDRRERGIGELRRRRSAAGTPQTAQPASGALDGDAGRRKGRSTANALSRLGA